MCRRARVAPRRRRWVADLRRFIGAEVARRHDPARSRRRGANWVTVRRRQRVTRQLGSSGQPAYRPRNHANDGFSDRQSTRPRCARIDIIRDLFTSESGKGSLLDSPTPVARGRRETPRPERTTWWPPSRRRNDECFWRCTPGNPPRRSDPNRVDASRRWECR